MGITFGDDAEVEVHGDMVGGHKIHGSAWNAVGAAIAESGGGLPQKTDAMQALSSIREEMKQEEPSPDKLSGFVETIKLLAPGAITALVQAVPEILKYVPALAG